MTIQHQAFGSIFPGGAGSIPSAFVAKGSVDASNVGSLPGGPTVGDLYIVSVTGGTKNFNGTWNAAAAAGFTGATFNVGDSIGYTAGGWVKFVGSATSTDDVINVSGVTGVTDTNALNTLQTEITNLAASNIANDSTVGGATVKDALQTLEADIGAVGTVYPFILRPGGVAVGNVFTTFAALYAVLSTNTGPRLLRFDKTLGAIPTITGTFDFTDVILEGTPEGDPVTTNQTLVTFGVGSVVTGLGEIRGNLRLKSTNTVNSLMTVNPSTSKHTLLKIYDGASIESQGGTKPFLEITGVGGNTFYIDLDTAGRIRGLDTVFINTVSNNLVINAGTGALITGNVLKDIMGAPPTGLNIFSPTVQYTTPQADLNTPLGVGVSTTMAQMGHPLREASTLSTNPFIVDVTDGNGDFRVAYDARTGPGAITLPSNIQGRYLIAKKHWLDTTYNAVQLNPQGGELIENVTSVQISRPNELMSFMATGGAGWDIHNRYGHGLQQIVKVSKDGNDTNANGSDDLPFLTIQAAINSITPSDPIRYTIDIGPGTYVETITLKSFITLYGAPDTVIIQNDAGPAVIAPSTMGNFGCNLTNINVVNNVTGIACWIKNQGSIFFNGGSCSSNDDDGILVEGNGFLGGINSAGFFSNTKNGAHLKDTSFGVFYGCELYSADGTLTYFDLLAEAGTFVKLNDDNDLQGTGTASILGGQILVSRSKYVIYDNTVSGLTAINVQDAIDELAAANSTSSATVNTTDATLTTLETIAIPSNSSVLIKTRIVGRRTGGIAGTAQDAGNYERTLRAKNVAGTVTIYDIQTDYTSEDQPAWDVSFVISGTNVLSKVTGAVNNNITWKSLTNKETV